jgi:hypothetical protein
MYTLERKIVLQLLFLICSATLAGAQEPAITLSELRQIVTDSRESITSVTTAHLVYIEDFNDNKPSTGDKDSVKYKVKEMHKHKRFKVDGILNCGTKSLKSSLMDLRDVDALLKEHNIPAVQKSVVSSSRIIVIQRPYEMELLNIDVSDAPPDLILSKCPGPKYYMFGLISLGIINEKLLSEDFGPTLSKFNSNGQSLLRIELTVERQNAMKAAIKIDCDPSLVYRFRRIQWHSDGQLIKETIADDYRYVNDVNNTIVVPYPFRYINRSFDKDGKIRRETKYVMEEVQLGVDLSPDDFKIFVPAGTQFIDTVVSMTTHPIYQSGYLGIDDALSIGSDLQLKR